MDYRMLLYVILLSAFFILARYRTIGFWWLRWQTSILVLCMVFSVLGLLGYATECFGIAATLFIIFMMFPALVRKNLEKKLTNPDELLVSPMFWLLSIVMPGPPGRFQGTLYRANSLAMAGRHEEAETHFAAALALSPPPSLRRLVIVESLKAMVYARQWQRLDEAYSALNEEEMAELYPVATMWHGRALLELGQIVEGLEETARALSFPQSVTLLPLAHLHLVAAAALSGDIDNFEREVEHLAPTLGQMAALVVPYWRGRCHNLRQELEEAKDAFAIARRANEEVNSPLWQRAIEERYEEVGKVEAAELDGGLYRLALFHIHEQMVKLHKGASFLHHRATTVTRVLMALLVVIWLGQEIMGGSLDGDSLVKAGAFIPKLVLNGDYWRLVSAVLLHAGGLHLAFNVLGLHLFGPAVESRLGSSVFLGLFFLSGVLGNLSGMWPLRDMIGVGASGGVMGILGATLVLLRSEVWSGLEEVRKRYLRDLVILLVANLVIGHVEAQVFNAAHIGGLLAGAVIAWPFCLQNAQKKWSMGLRRAVGLSGLLLGLYGLWGMAPGWFVPAAQLPVIRREIPQSSISFELPAHWRVHKEEERLWAVNDDKTLLMLVALNDLSAKYEGLELQAYFSHHFFQGLKSEAGTKVVSAPNFELLTSGGYPSWVYKRENLTLHEEVRVKRLGKIVVVGRFTTQLKNLARRRPTFGRVMRSLK